ncbi:MAG TPA: adenine deaminase [Tepidisphaeraceae bacterium]|jgi:adenine deaminase|nr:adenine deaminase [Tepidisphaeraceae bacterium]
MSFSVSGNIVDVLRQRVFGGTVFVAGGKIERIEEDGKRYETYLMPGFVDGHVHVESSMLVPSEFARLAVVHGTVATVSDPHEIGNVLGVAGVEYMIEVGKTVPFKFCFGAPACVPATGFETAGAVIGPGEVEELLSRPEVGYLSEVMNFPGVINGDVDMLAKIAAAKRVGKRVDGHAPGLRGEMCRKYLAAGIETDHECFTQEEAEEKLALGCKILIREGSAARNFEALYRLIDRFPDRCMFATDDMHPDTLVRGHIDRLAARAIGLGMDVMNVLRVGCVNAVEHYGLKVGLLRVGDAADFIEVGDLKELRVRRTWIDGGLVAERRRSLLIPGKARVVNRFEAGVKEEGDFATPSGGTHVRVIEAMDGELITRSLRVAREEIGIEGDVLKIAVVNRYEREAKPAVGFIRGFGLKRGAMASSVAHDSHNIVAVGVTDEELSEAVNAVIRERGGLAAVDGRRVEVLGLPVAGIMSNEDGYVVAQRYGELEEMVKGMGTGLRAPFMTLSFMALLVIPSLKMSDRGLFDGDLFRLVDLAD